MSDSIEHSRNYDDKTPLNTLEEELIRIRKLRPSLERIDEPTLGQTKRHSLV